MEIVHDGIDGFVVPCRDRDSFEQAIEKLILDRTLLDRLRHNAYAAAQRFSWSKVAQLNLDCYEKARSMKR
jgi:glycosyltransferase involved in cell wall biosynthesis